MATREEETKERDAAIERERAAGRTAFASLAEANKAAEERDAARQGGAQPTDTDTASGLDVSLDGISASTPAVDRADVERQVEEKFGAQRQQLASQFDRRISEVRGLGEQEEKALEGRLGTRRRFSSSAEAFISFIDDKFKKEINTLEEQKAQALSNFDFKLAEMVESRIVAQREAQQQEFDNAIKIMQIEESREAREAQKKKKEKTIVPQSDKDAAILIAMQDGATSVADIFATIRNQGGDVSLEDINDGLESLGLSTKTTENAAEKLTGDAKNFLLLKESFPDLIPADVSALPENQQLGAYIRFVEERGTLPKTTTIKGTGTKTALPGEAAYNQDILTARVGKQIYGTRISDAESERVARFIEAGMEQGKSELEIMDDVLGFTIERNAPLAHGLRDVLLSVAGEDGLAGFDMLGLARLVNEGKESQAIQRVEQQVYEKALKQNPQFYIGEETARFADTKTREVEILVLGASEVIGPFQGTMQQWLKKLKKNEAAKIQSQLVSLTAEMRNRLSGTAVTESEAKFLEPLIPSLSDTTENFLTKLQELRSDPLLRLNTIRKTFNLPNIDRKQLQNRDLRAPLYMKAAKPEFSDEDFFDQPLPADDDFNIKDYDASVWEEAP